MRKPLEEERRKTGEMNGEQWVTLLKKADLAKTTEKKRHWRRLAMRAFYGDNRGDEYA